MSSLFDDDSDEFDDIDFDDDHHDPLPRAALLPPRESSYFISHDTIEKKLLELVKLDKFPHGLIFNGIAGIGKATFAYRLSRFLFKYGGQPADDGLFGDAAPQLWPENMDVAADDPVFRRIASGGHPDFMALEPEEGKKGLDVEQVRKIIPFLRRTASEGGWRIVLIDNADTMNRNAQNALLKILEEPPARTALILIANNTAAFLPTIKSRCRTFNFKPLELDEFKEILREEDASLGADKLQTLYDMCDTSAGQALEYMNTQGLDLFTQWQGLISSYPSFNYEEVHKFCELFARGVQENVWNGFCRNVIWAFESLSLCKAKGDSLPAILQPLAVFSESCTLDQLLKICEDLKEHLKQANFGNLDKRQAALETFMLLEP